jgi:hypothetical protein
MFASPPPKELSPNVETLCFDITNTEFESTKNSINFSYSVVWKELSVLRDKYFFDTRIETSPITQFSKQNALLFNTKGISRGFLFCAKQEFLKKQYRDLKKFLRAIDKAGEFIRNNKEKAKEIVSGRLKTDREVVDVEWDDFKFGLFLDQSILLTLEDEARWTIDNNLTNSTKIPNYLDYIYTDVLESVKPEAVTVIS